MPSSKSQSPPRPVRDARADSGAPVPLLEDIRPSARQVRTSREVPVPPPVTPPVTPYASSDVDADDFGAMLVRVADTERARDASERRASGLEEWTQALEAKVAEARTRADEAEERAGKQAEELAAARQDAERSRLRVKALEVELETTRRESEDALELERVKRGLEIDAMVNQHQTALEAARQGPSSAAASTGTKESLAKVVTMIEDLVRQEEQTGAMRTALLEQARRVLGTDRATAPPPPMPGKSVAAPTMPPQNRGPKKRSRRPPAPPLPPAARTTVEIAATDTKLETFEDLDLD